MTLRRYVESDQEPVLAVFLESTIAGQAFLPEEFWQDQIPIIRDELMSLAKTWVVEEDGTVVAFRCSMT